MGRKARLLKNPGRFAGKYGTKFSRFLASRLKEAQDAIDAVTEKLDETLDEFQNLIDQAKEETEEISEPEVKAKPHQSKKTATKKKVPTAARSRKRKTKETS